MILMETIINKVMTMVKVLSESKQIARKDYECEACTCVLNQGYDGMGFSREERRTLVKARKNNWKIVKGQEYLKQKNIYEGVVFKFKAIPSVHDICIKYDLYAV